MKNIVKTKSLKTSFARRNKKLRLKTQPDSQLVWKTEFLVVHIRLNKLLYGMKKQMIKLGSWRKTANWYV